MKKVKWIKVLNLIFVPSLLPDLFGDSLTIVIFCKLKCYIFMNEKKEDEKAYHTHLNCVIVG